MSFFPRLIVALRKPVVMAVKKPTPLTYIGAGRLRQAAELLRQTGSHRVLLMTTPGMMRRGQLDQTLSELQENGMEAVVFDRVSPDPTFGVVEEAVGCAAGCDAILAVGGGSVLDAAKTAAAAIANHKPGRKAGRHPKGEKAADAAHCGSHHGRHRQRDHHRRRHQWDRDPPQAPDPRSQARALCRHPRSGADGRPAAGEYHPHRNGCSDPRHGGLCFHLRQPGESTAMPKWPPK